MANAKGITLTKADLDRVRAQDAKASPARRRAISKGLVEANTEANTPKSARKKRKV